MRRRPRSDSPSLRRLRIRSAERVALCAAAIVLLIAAAAAVLAVSRVTAWPLTKVDIAGKPGATASFFDDDQGTLVISVRSPRELYLAPVLREDLGFAALGVDRTRVCAFGVPVAYLDVPHFSVTPQPGRNSPSPGELLSLTDRVMDKFRADRDVARLWNLRNGDSAARFPFQVSLDPRVHIDVRGVVIASLVLLGNALPCAVLVCFFIDRRFVNRINMACCPACGYAVLKSPAPICPECSLELDAGLLERLGNEPDAQARGGRTESPDAS